MGWWHLVETDKGQRIAPRWVTRSRLPDLLPEVLWRRGVVCFGGRMHFCVGHLQAAHRTIEWKGTDWLVGRGTFSAAHREREPNRFDEPDSYDDDK
jgi:hypothetical protein